jgi:chromosome segregation protein
VRFLKHLVLQGYKTFASRTEFVFDGGVTAVIGPNGSGKSNIADALRWVLGEQSYGSLRGKRTEDMIFSGSEQRPRMGMAHVSLILDNSTGWLPIDFSEVEIARRAYRSGENEYYLNGNRVRLRDITELLGSSGLSERTYSIIGQGLVDQALSQRPEERRRLFEEAAGITVYQSKRDQASQKLTDAGGNLTRARDIINELTPRLRYLKGQARRAQEYQQLRRDLEAQLLVWYGYKWRRGLLAIAAAKDRATDSARVAEEATDELNALLELVATRRTERNALRDQLSEWHRASSSLHRESEVAQRELAVRAEQLRLWREQGEDLERDLIHLRAGLEDGSQRQAAAAAELAEALAGHQANAARVAAAQGELAARERERQAQTAKLNQAQDALLLLKTQLAERRSRLAQSGERRAELARGDVEQAQASQAAAAQLAAQEAEFAKLAVRVAELTAALAEVDRERQAQAQTLAGAQEAERKAAEGLAIAQRALGRLVDQQDMLNRLRDEGAGLGSGARAVVAATRSAPSRTGGGAGAAVAPLHGVIGTLGELIEVPAELERAVEAALGGRVQDIVVEGWQDAEAAVDFLKRNQAGRATFLPLDSLRPGRASDVPRAAGVLGLASELVKFDAAIRPAVELALNHTVVVEDLPTARRLLGRAGGATLVTLDGEIVRSSGSVTGGAENRAKDSGMLSRARTLRELPPQIEAGTAQVAAHEARVAAARREQATARTALDTLRAKREGIASELSRAGAEQGRVGLAGDRARQTQAFHDERRRGLAKDLAGLDLRERELKTAVDELGGRLTAQEAEVETARRGLLALAADDLVGELARLRAEAAVSAGQLQSYQSRVAELATAQQARTVEVSAKTARLQTLIANQAEAGRIIEAQEAIASRLARQIAALSANIDPAEARVAELEAQQRQLETTERNLREQLRHGQMRQSQSDLTHQRAHDELAHLRTEIEKDLGLVELTQALDDAEGSPAVDEMVDSQPPLPLDDMVTRLPLVVELPEGLDSDVRNLRGQLGRLGSVNLDALAEYNEVEARYNFLTTQAADLEHAVASLQEIIAELDQVMEREFLATFKAIAGKFKDEFSTLFGGGAAKLVLSDPESPNTTGIEIIARPPGKREQGLALLSGGERTLTAAALIFSILKTRPTPFCVLDEVDAALDEANVGRFRDALKSLAVQTQFILITHNRGTIEAADTIYGVSMGADHTSTTLSLRLDGHELVPAALDEAS